MQLLPEDKLIWSPVVANSRMNRERNSSGINSYEQELKFKPEEYLLSVINKSGKTAWIDICCGQGKALLQTADHFQRMRLLDKMTLEGIDLVDSFLQYEGISAVKFHAMPVVNWIPNRQYDLITCVHGLHYIGDKLKVIETALNCLTATGLFIANLDLNNISIQSKNSTSFLKNLFLGRGLKYNARQKLVTCSGKIQVSFDLNYRGADDSYGPNYTGQDSVVSYYSTT